MTYIKRHIVKNFVWGVFVICMILGSGMAHADITTGLVGHWMFDEKQGTVANDSSGQGNQGALAGASIPQWGSSGAVVGSGDLLFNGSSSYVDAGVNPVLSGGNAITVSAWIKPKVTNGYIITKGQGQAGWDLMLSNGRISFDIAYNTSPGGWPAVNILSSSSINTTGNYWTHVVATYTCNNGIGSPACTSGTTGQISLYINGVQDTQAVVYAGGYMAATAYTGGAPIYTGTMNTRIGGRNGDLPQMTPSPFPFFSGVIDDVRVYNRALSANDITALYGTGTPPASPKDIYISQSTQGVGDGSSCSHAYSLEWLNAMYRNTVTAYSLSWASGMMPGQIYPGVTVHLCGVISTGINIPIGGTEGKPISIKFEPGAKMSAPAFTQAISSRSGANVSYITIDGCYGAEDALGKCIATGVADAQGNDTAKAIIENTNNGSPYEYWPQYCNSVKPAQWGDNAVVCDNIVNKSILTINPTYPNYQQTNTTAISLPGGTHNIIKNLTIQNLYRRAPGSGDPSGGFGGFVTQDEVEYACPASRTPTSCDETTPSGLSWHDVVQKLVSYGWATQPITTAIVGTSQYYNDSSLEQDMTSLFGSNAAAKYIMNLFTNNGARPGSSTGIKAPGASDILIQNNTLKMVQTGIGVSFAPGQKNVTIDANEILGFNHGIEMGYGGHGNSPAPTLDRLVISNNRIDGMDVWENANITPMGCAPFDPPACGYADIGFHRDPIFLFLTDPDGLLKNIDIYNNHIGPGFNPLTNCSGTAAFFEDIPLAAQVENLRVYNNVFDLKSVLGYADGFGGAGGMNSLFANNTVVGDGGVGAGGKNSYIYNNIKIRSSIGLSLRINDTANPLLGQPGHDPNVWYLDQSFSDYNLLSGIDPGNTNAFLISSVVIPDTLMNFAGWQKLHSAPLDISSLFGLNLNPYLVDSNPDDGAADYHLLSYSPAINAGMNLTSFCNGWPQPGPVDGDPGVPAPALCQDKDGHPRPATGPWDIGAYFFDGIRPQPGAPVAYGQSLYMTIGGILNITLTGASSQGHALTYQLLTQPSNGRVSGMAPYLVYTPDAGAATDHFTFTVTDTVSGLVSNVAPVSITINNMSVTVSSPDGTTFNTGSNILLSATAFESGPEAVAISRVDFFSGKINIGTVTKGGSGNAGNTYNLSWPNVPNGSYMVAVQATDVNRKIAISAAVNIVVSSSPPDIVSNLSGYWKFDDCPSLTACYVSAADSSGNNNFGTLVGSPAWVPGKSGGALKFNGSSSVSIPKINITSGYVPITVSAWVYASSASESGQIISRMDDTNVLTNYTDWLLRFEGSDNHLAFYDVSSGNSALYKVDSMAAITSGSWHHVAVTYDGHSSTIMNFYMDGVLTSSSAVYSGFGFPHQARGPVKIGSASSAMMDEVRVYSRALAPQDINALFNMGQPQPVRGSGDVSGDGRVTMYDAALVLKYTVGGLLTTAQQAQADMNGDTAIDDADAMAIAKKALE